MQVFFKMKATMLLLLMWCVVEAFSLKIVDDYRLNVTTTGPAVYGSNITFHAVLYLGTSQMPEDPSQFRYEWRSSADGLKATQHASFSTSLGRCYDMTILPREYKMELDVYSDSKFAFSPIVSKLVEFHITQTLNGNLKFNQTVYRSATVNNSTFSTILPVNITANLTDIFEHVPNIDYKWYINGKENGGGNSPDSTYEFSKPGKYTVKVEVVSNGNVTDCKNNVYKKQLTGSFEADLDLKDPVSNLTMFGKKSVKEGQEVTLTAVFRGSSPYTFCWNLSSVDKLDVVLNSSCTPVDDAPIMFITLSPSSLPHRGKYILNILVENDISVLKGHHFINVTAGPTPIPQRSTHSAGTVLGPVLGVLGAITLTLFLTLGYINYRRNRLHHIESADFTFHSDIQITPKRSGFWSSLKERMQALYISGNRWQRIDDGTDRQDSGQYGTLMSLM